MASKPVLCIVGLGYVGLPLAYAFAKKGYDVWGYDINESRIAELKQGKDRTNERTTEELSSVEMTFSSDPEIIGKADIVILALPTPVDEKQNPDLTLLEQASRTVGEHLKKGAIVVYESTVYPGVTEEICGPILEQASGLTCGTDFTLGYSPERINPGDKVHTVEKICKIVAGQDEKTLNALTELYGSIVEAGIHKASSIKVAEMAKAIENAQRDLNIAYINEVAMLCNAIGISTKDVLDAASTKWNFLKFSPGLVGGHCIGVDPYYLVEKARQLGMDTKVITAGRSTNDAMSNVVAEQIKNNLATPINQARILVLGLTFKENVPDMRNSKSAEVIHNLRKAGASVYVHDDELSDEVIKSMNLEIGSLAEIYDAVVLLVPHQSYLDNPQELIDATKEKGLIYDLKSVLNPEKIQQAKRTYKAL